MADPVVDNADYAVDELKRKARRRLVGAVILALAAATVLPMLLEQDQKPLGDDVSVQIPPVDGDKFVSRLKAGDAGAAAGDATVRSGAITTSPGKGGTAPATPAPAPPAPAAAPSPTKSAPPPAPPAPSAAASLPTASPAASDAKPAAAQSKPAGAAPGGASDAKSAKAGEPKGAAPAEPASPAPSSSATLATSSLPTAAGSDAATAAAAPTTSEGFVVQLGAFTDKYGANALARKLKAGGYPAYTEPVETSRGTLWRVRVGGYPTRAAAVDARGKLKADGHDGVVTAAK